MPANGRPTEGRIKSLGSLPKGEELSLLDRVIKESMRVLPASAYSQRINTVAVQLGPLHLPRGTGIVFTPLIDHHLAGLVSAAGEVHAGSVDNVAAQPVRLSSVRRRTAVVHRRPAGDRDHPHRAASGFLRGIGFPSCPAATSACTSNRRCCFPTNGVPMQIHAADGNFDSNPIAAIFTSWSSSTKCRHWRDG